MALVVGATVSLVIGVETGVVLIYYLYTLLFIIEVVSFGVMTTLITPITFSKGHIT